MRAMSIALLVSGVLAVWTGTAAAQQKVPAFSLPETTHHFVLTKDGGVIFAEATNPDDTITPDLIQTRLARVAMTGLDALLPLKANINYRFEATDQGGQVVIRTSDPKTLNAIHDFLRLEIRELQTNDSDQIN